MHDNDIYTNEVYSYVPEFRHHHCGHSYLVSLLFAAPIPTLVIFVKFLPFVTDIINRMSRSFQAKRDLTLLLPLCIARNCFMRNTCTNTLAYRLGTLQWKWSCQHIQWHYQTLAHSSYKLFTKHLNSRLL